MKDKILIYPYGVGGTLGDYDLYVLKRFGNAPKALININEYVYPINVAGAIMSRIPMIYELDINPLDYIVDGDFVILSNNILSARVH